MDVDTTATNFFQDNHLADDWPEPFFLRIQNNPPQRYYRISIDVERLLKMKRIKEINRELGNY